MYVMVVSSCFVNLAVWRKASRLMSDYSFDDVLEINNSGNSRNEYMGEAQQVLCKMIGSSKLMKSFDIINCPSLFHLLSPEHQNPPLYVYCTTV